MCHTGRIGTTISHLLMPALSAEIDHAEQHGMPAGRPVHEALGNRGSHPPGPAIGVEQVGAEFGRHVALQLVQGGVNEGGRFYFHEKSMRQKKGKRYKPFGKWQGENADQLRDVNPSRMAYLVNSAVL